MRLQTKRSIGITVALVVLAAFAGCSALGGGSSDSCGPGDSKIENINESSGEKVTIQGEVVKTGPGSIAVDDGTGKAFVMGQFDVDSGACVQVEGTTHAGSMVGGSGDQQMDVDVMIRSANVTES